MGNSSEGRRAALHSLSGRKRGLIAALAVAGSLAAVPVAAAAPGDTFTWTGQGNDSNWSTAGNWGANVAPTAGDTNAFVFPGDISGQTSSNIDQTGDTADGLTISGDAGYQVNGDALTLAQPDTGDALDVTSDSSAGDFGDSAAINSDLTLAGGAQTWAIDGGTDQAGGIALSNVTGTAAVDVDVTRGGRLSFGDFPVENSGDAEVGPLTITETDANGGADGGNGEIGTLDLAENVNATNNNPVSIHDMDVELNGDQTVGPLTLDASVASVGGNTGALTSTGNVSMDSDNLLEVSLGSEAGLTAHGNIVLNGELGLEEPYINDPDNDDGNGLCPSVSVGSTQTLVQADGGTISGTFDDFGASGGEIDAYDYCADSPGGQPTDHDYPYRIDYTPSSVTATVINTSTTTIAASSATPAAGSPETYTATVAPSGATGTVQFYDDNAGTPVACQNATDGTVAVSNGTATCVTTYATVGTEADVEADYSGDANDSASYSDDVTVKVGPAVAAAPAPAPAPAPVAAPPAGTGASTVAKVTAAKGVVTVPITCAAGGASCTVTLKLTTVVTSKNKKGKTVKKTVVLGTRTVTVAAGASSKASVTLNKAGKALLAKDKSLTTKVSVSSKTASGTTKTTSKSVKVTATAPKKSKKGGKKKH